MTNDAVERNIERITGLSLSQYRATIAAAIQGALEEIGVHMTVPTAITRESMSISASDNSVNWIKEYSRIVSVTYEYTESSSIYDRPLFKVNPTEFEARNAGLQDLETDLIEHYCPMQGKIFVGPGNVDTGGNLIILWQRKLNIQDIDKLPNGMLVVYGAVANVLPATDPQQGVYRNMFVSNISSAATASTPVKEKRSRIQLNDQVLRDELFLQDL